MIIRRFTQVIGGRGFVSMRKSPGTESLVISLKIPVVLV